MRRPLLLAAAGGLAALSVGWAGYRLVTSVDDAPAPDAAVVRDTAARVAAAKATAGPAAVPANAIRCAVIGGMTFTGFWDALAERYERQTGVPVVVMATGEKDSVATAFRAGEIDVVTMHASDTIINLVADGYALNPQPWMRNDLILVGPAADPAGIKGTTDAAAALRSIIAAKSPFVMPSSLGAQEVLRNVMNAGKLAFDPAQVTTLVDDPQRAVLHLAAVKSAYTVVGRIPFRTGRIPNEGMQLMVEGDPALRRPYVVAVANPTASRASGPRRPGDSPAFCVRRTRSAGSPTSAAGGSTTNRCSSPSQSAPERPTKTATLTRSSHDIACLLARSEHAMRVRLPQCRNEETGVHPGRTVGRNRHHRALDQHPAAEPE